MPTYDAATIVPSTRDLLQAIATRRQGLAVVALVGDEKADLEAARLDALEVAALAFVEPGPAMALAARSTRSLPALSLAPVADGDACLAARFHGADGACLDAALPVDALTELAKAVRATRMLPVAAATSADQIARVVEAGAKAVLVRAGSTADVIAAAASVPRSVALIADVPDLDEAGLRALVGHADAALVRFAVHAATGFEALVAELGA